MNETVDKKVSFEANSYDVLTVASEILKKARDKDLSVTPMKLLKLAYIAQGYNLAIFDQPLFANPIEAWQYGPVIPVLYERVKQFRDSNIPAEAVPKIEGEQISDTHKMLVDVVLDRYGKYSGGQLSTLTHKEGTPWSAVFDGPSSFGVEIPNRDIALHYKGLLK